MHSTRPAAPTPDGDVLAVDRLDCYRLAVEFCALANDIRPASRDLRDQLERASASVVLNLAEGVGRATRADQARLFMIARGSAFECVAALDVLRARRALREETYDTGRAMLVRIVRMLSRLAMAGG